jgi:hypothetical protein
MEHRSHTLSNMKVEGVVGGKRDETSVAWLGTGLKCRARDGIDLRPTAGLSSWLQPGYMV